MLHFLFFLVPIVLAFGDYDSILTMFMVNCESLHGIVTITAKPSDHACPGSGSGLYGCQIDIL